MSKKASRKELIAALQSLVKEIDRTPRQTDMDQHGQYSRGPYQREFDSWNDALQAAGLQPNKPQNITREDLLDALHGLADELGKVPTREEMNEHGEFSRGPYDREFGGWNQALEAAGLDVNKPVRLSREELLSELTRLAAAIERVPRQKDINERGNYSERAYKREWDGWNAALRAAGFEPNKPHDIEYPTKTCPHCGEKFPVKPSREETRQYCTRSCLASSRTGKDNPHPNAGKRVTKTCEWCGDIFEAHLYAADKRRFCSPECVAEHKSETMVGENHWRYKPDSHDYYGPDWESKRTQALERDGYECVECGIGQSEHIEKYDYDLSIHHIKPRSEYYEDGVFDYTSANQLDNLMTLCKNCHAKIENGSSNGFGGD